MVLSAFWCTSAHAALPACASAASDSDGDGFGWENNTSCEVVAAAAASTSGTPTCASAASDPDGDGYGWENNQSCVVSAAAPSSNSGTAGSATAVCASANSDPDGDGYGWENNQSCVVASDAGGTQGSAPSADDTPSCAFTASDPDGDGYGWENNASCRITANSATIGSPSNAGSGSADQGQNNAGSGSADLGQGGNSASFPANNSGNFSAGTGGGAIIRSSSLATSGARELCTTPDEDWFGWFQVGDFILHTNTWAAWASQDYDWSQCIYTNQNGAQAGVYYDWGPGRGSGDYQVRSYPELIYGVKDEYRRLPKSVTGLPVAIEDLPGITIDYSMNWPEYGPERAVNASANPRYPNGSIIQGERNVSIESFFYNPDQNGQCSEDVVQRSGGSNHTFEIMVWLNAGAERLPAGPSDYVTDVTLDNVLYKVYTKNSDPKYIAFVAQNPQQTGSLNWNTFIEWTGNNAHQVQSRFGAQTNAVPLQKTWCMGNIIVGTEIFWGEGNLDFIDWTITQRR